MAIILINHDFACISLRGKSIMADRTQGVTTMSPSVRFPASPECRLIAGLKIDMSRTTHCIHVPRQFRRQLRQLPTK